MGLPTDLSVLRRCQLRRAQMIRVDVVPVGVRCRQAATGAIGLPDRIGAPQPLLHGCRIEAVSLGELSCLVRFCHQPLLAVQEVGRCCASLLHALGNSAPERVIPVAGLQARAALPLVRCLIPRQPLGRVVLVALFPLRAGFLARVPLRRVADRGVDGCCLAERCGSGVLRELVVPVVAVGEELPIQRG